MLHYDLPAVVKSGLLFSILILLIMLGCSPDKPVSTEPETTIINQTLGYNEAMQYVPYDDVLAEWKSSLNNYLSNKWTENDPFNFLFYGGYTTSIETFYALYDIDDNGIMELLLKIQNSDFEDSIAYIFTLTDGAPVNLFGYNNEGLPREVPWSRVGSCKILDNGLIDCYDGDYTVYQIAENGYSVNKIASAQPYDYPNEAEKAEAKWKFFINEIEVDFESYVQCLNEYGYAENRDNPLASIDWKSID